MSDAPDIFVLLTEIEKHPSKYLGKDGDRVRQLQQLEAMVWGYRAAVLMHDIVERVPDFTQGFSDFLRDEHGWSTTLGPFRAIRSQVREPEQAWKRTWKLIWEYRDALAAGS